jgi:hypothetical protein
MSEAQTPVDVATSLAMSANCALLCPTRFNVTAPSAGWISRIPRRFEARSWPAQLRFWAPELTGVTSPTTSNRPGGRRAPVVTDQLVCWFGYGEAAARS